MKKFPKIMPDPTSKNGFTGMTPADDKLLRYVDGVKRNDPKTLKAIDDYSEQLHYNSTLGQFVKGNKRGSLSDFKKAYDFPVVFTRAANVYGPGQQLYRIIPRTILYSRLNKKLNLRQLH